MLFRCSFFMCWEVFFFPDFGLFMSFSVFFLLLMLRAFSSLKLYIHTSIFPKTSLMSFCLTGRFFSHSGADFSDYSDTTWMHFMAQVVTERNYPLSRNFYQPQKWSPVYFWGPAGRRSLPALQRHTPKGSLWTWSHPASYWEQPPHGRGSLGEGDECYTQMSHKINMTSVFGLTTIRVALTDGCKDVGETEVINSVKGEEVVEKLLLLIVTAEEGVTLVQFPERTKKIVRGKCKKQMSMLRLSQFNYICYFRRVTFLNSVISMMIYQS